MLTPKSRALCWSLLVSALLFLPLLFIVPGSGQKDVFPYTPYCDYRVFMLPCMTSENPYCPTEGNIFDACYPAIAYCVTSALSTDRGNTWMPKGREWVHLGLIAVLEILGLYLLLLVGMSKDRWLVFFALLMSPAMMAAVLRGNPSGWSFAFACMFLFGYDNQSPALRMSAAVSLGIAVSLKLSPVVFGLLYISGNALHPGRWPTREILVSGLTALVMMFVPFVFFGGVESIPQWVSNALENSRYYSIQEPIWGFVSVVQRFDSSPGMARFANEAAMLTNMMAVCVAGAVLFVHSPYLRLMGIGSVMAFLTHHDYGASYLIPAFVAWLSDESMVKCPETRVILALEWISWFLILTPLQIPGPYGKSMNFALQGESLFILLIAATIRAIRCRAHVLT